MRHISEALGGMNCFATYIKGGVDTPRRCGSQDQRGLLEDLDIRSLRALFYGWI